MPDDKVPATPEEVEAALKAAYAAGQEAAQAEGQPDVFEFSNGQFGSARGGDSEYELEVAAKVRELRAAGNTRSLHRHKEIAAIRARHGR